MKRAHPDSEMEVPGPVVDVREVLILINHV